MPISAIKRHKQSRIRPRDHSPPWCQNGRWDGLESLYDETDVYISKGKQKGKQKQFRLDGNGMLYFVYIVQKGGSGGRGCNACDPAAALNLERETGPFWPCGWEEPLLILP